MTSFYDTSLTVEPRPKPAHQKRGAAVEKCYGHSVGNLSRYLCLFTKLQEVYPGCRLQYAVRPAASKAEAEAWEAEAVKEYVIRRGQMPLLSRVLPRAYDDEVWNSV